MISYCPSCGSCLVDDKCPNCLTKELTPEELLADFPEPTKEWWDAYLKWGDACNDAAEEQYREEQKVKP